MGARSCHDGIPPIGWYFTQGRGHDFAVLLYVFVQVFLSPPAGAGTPSSGAVGTQTCSGSSHLRRSDPQWNDARRQSPHASVCEASPLDMRVRDRNMRAMNPGKRAEGCKRVPRTLLFLTPTCLGQGPGSGRRCGAPKRTLREKNWTAACRSKTRTRTCSEDEHPEQGKAANGQPRASD